MIRLAQPFNALLVTPSGIFEPIPKGWYVAVIEASAIKRTKDGTGIYFEFRFRITDGPHKGRMLWDRFNVRNRSTKAVEIATERFAKLCYSAGIINYQSHSDLHGIPLRVFVVQKGRYNVVRDYRDRNGLKRWVSQQR